jgi:hypothetical protein
VRGGTYFFGLGRAKRSNRKKRRGGVPPQPPKLSPSKALPFVVRRSSCCGNLRGGLNAARSGQRHPHASPPAPQKTPGVSNARLKVPSIDPACHNSILETGCAQNGCAETAAPNVVYRDRGRNLALRRRRSAIPASAAKPPYDCAMPSKGCRADTEPRIPNGESRNMNGEPMMIKGSLTRGR